jgi:predicted component of type VI protein secretion system
LDGTVFVEQKPREGREVQATPDAVIGREGTDIVLQDPEVSRRHAAIRVQGEGVAIEDLGSTNGTFVNDERIEGTRALTDGDTVRFGNTTWVLRAPTVSGATTVGQVAAPQVTSARPIPVEPAAPQPAAPQPAPPSSAPVGARGDVPAPPEVVPSAVRRVVVPPTPGNAPAFTPPAPRKGGSAATRVEATVVCLLFALAVAVAIAIYFASQG